MGFWNRILGHPGDAGRLDSRAAGVPGPRTGRHLRAGGGGLNCDPREAAQALHMALAAARELGFTPHREITVDDIDFTFYGGVDGFTAERISALFHLEDDSGAPFFSRVFTFEAESIESNDAYAHLLRRMAEAAGTPRRFSDIHCDLHFGPHFAEDPVGELHYACNGEQVRHSIAVEGDWADPDVIRKMLIEVTPKGHRWVSTSDYSIHAWVPEKGAESLVRVFAQEDAAASERLHRQAGERQRDRG